MGTTYIRLQIYFIISVVVGYLAFLAVWFHIDDRLLKEQSEKDFKGIIQIRNQVRDNLFNVSQQNTLSDNKLKILRVITNEWLNSLVGEIDSKRQSQRERINSLGAPIAKTSGIYISKKKRFYLKSGNDFEEQFGKNWSADFFSALRHGGRYFSSFTTKFYGSSVTLKDFQSKTDKYQILNIRDNYYYLFYTKIDNFEILIFIDLDKTDANITLNHYLNNLVKSDERLQRNWQDSLVWANQEIYLSKKLAYGLRFIPYRSGWVDFLIAKWIIHILFVLLLVFLIGLGGYQILSLRLEFRILVFISICFLLISMIYRYQFNKNLQVQLSLIDHQRRITTNKLASELYINYRKEMYRILKKLDNDIKIEIPFAGLSMSTNSAGQTKFIDDIGNPILLKLLSEIMRRYHLTRKGYDPDKISLSDERDNRLLINLPSTRGLIVPRLMSYALKQIRKIRPGNEGQRYLQFSIMGEEYILFVPGQSLYSVDVINVVCVKREELINYVASKTDWNSRRIALINLKKMRPVFQNFKPHWTRSKIEKFVLNRNLPSAFKDEKDVLWCYLKWDDFLLLMKTPRTVSRSNNRKDALVSILCLILGFMSIFILRNGLFNWLTNSKKLFNSYRLRKQIISSNHVWFRNEGHTFNSVVEAFIKNIDSKSKQELQMSQAMAEFLLLKENKIGSIAVIEIAFSGLDREHLAEFIEVMVGELQRFNGFQLDAGAQCVKLCFPLDIDNNAVQNAAEAGLALSEFLRKVNKNQFYTLLRTGNFQLSFKKEPGLEYPLLSLTEIDVQKRPKENIVNKLIIDKTSYQSLFQLYDLEHTAESYYHFIAENLEG